MKYRILKKGVVQGGDAEITIAPDGEVKCSGRVKLKIGKGWFSYSKTVDFNKTRGIGENIAQSKNYSDNFEESDAMKISIYHRDGRYANAHVLWKPDDISLNARLFLGNPIIEILSAKASVSAIGLRITVEMQKV